MVILHCTWPVDLVGDAAHDFNPDSLVLGVEEIIYVLLSVSTKDEVNAKNKKDKTEFLETIKDCDYLCARLEKIVSNCQVMNLFENA